MGSVRVLSTGAHVLLSLRCIAPQAHAGVLVEINHCMEMRRGQGSREVSQTLGWLFPWGCLEEAAERPIWALGICRLKSEGWEVRAPRCGLAPQRDVCQKQRGANWRQPHDRMDCSQVPVTGGPRRSPCTWSTLLPDKAHSNAEAQPETTKATSWTWKIQGTRRQRNPEYLHLMVPWWNYKQK